MKRLLALLLCLFMLPLSVLAEPITPDENETGPKPWGDVTFEKVLVSIYVTSPTKTEYFLGDTLDTSGMTVTAIYNNGTTKDVTADATVDVATLTTAGTVTVTVTYGGKSDTFEVEVTPVVVESIAVTAPTKTHYFVGDTLNTVGMTVTATYNNGTTKDVTADATVDVTTLTTAGTKTVTVTYDGKSDTFEVELIPVVVESIAVTAPTKTEYFVGDTLNTAGMTVIANYNDGTTKDVTADASVNVTTLTTAGTVTVTVTYDGKSDTFTVNVTAVQLGKTVVISADDVMARPGTTFELPITLSENSGILGMNLYITFSDVLELVAVEQGTALPSFSMTQGGDLSASPYNIIWDGIDTDNTNGEVVILTFKVLDDTAEGDYSINVSGISSDEQYNEFDIPAISAKVTVKHYTPGDINGDGMLTSIDITLLRRYIVGGYGVEDKVVEAALDINRDGTLTSTDVTMLRRYIAGGYGVELK